jgi:hypothetical protein
MTAQVQVSASRRLEIWGAVRSASLLRKSILDVPAGICEHRQVRNIQFLCQIQGAINLFNINRLLRAMSGRP